MTHLNRQPKEKKGAVNVHATGPVKVNRAIELAIGQSRKAVRKKAPDALPVGVSLIGRLSNTDRSPAGRGAGRGGWGEAGSSRYSGRSLSGKQPYVLIIAEVQKQFFGSFIDAEHALDIEYAKKPRGGDRLFPLSQPDTGEQALEIADMLIRRRRWINASAAHGRGASSEGRT